MSPIWRLPDFEVVILNLKVISAVASVWMESDTPSTAMPAPLGNTKIPERKVTHSVAFLLHFTGSEHEKEDK